MSAPVTEPRVGTPDVQIEQRSAIKIVMNAKHDVQWEIKVVAGDGDIELDRIRSVAVRQHELLIESLIRRDAVRA